LIHVGVHDGGRALASSIDGFSDGGGFAHAAILRTLLREMEAGR